MHSGENFALRVERLLRHRCIRHDQLMHLYWILGASGTAAITKTPRARVFRVDRLDQDTLHRARAFVAQVERVAGASRARRHAPPSEPPRAPPNVETDRPDARQLGALVRARFKVFSAMSRAQHTARLPTLTPCGATRCRAETRESDPRASAADQWYTQVIKSIRSTGKRDDAWMVPQPQSAALFVHLRERANPQIKRKKAPPPTPQPPQHQSSESCSDDPEWPEEDLAEEAASLEEDEAEEPEDEESSVDESEDNDEPLERVTGDSALSDEGS